MGNIEVMKRVFFSRLFFLLMGSASAQEIPVLMRLTANAQMDTTGCNFVCELSSLAFEEVMQNKLELWDSPEKETRISPLSLKAICESSGVNMKSDPGLIVYVYEFWSQDKSGLKSRTEGFLFACKKEGAKELSFGYAEYNAIESACLRQKINTNVNGDYNATVASYISSKNYNFHILQFNGKVLSGVEESDQILSLYRKGRTFNAYRGNNLPVQVRLVQMQLENDLRTTSAEVFASTYFILRLDSFFHSNEEFLYNILPDSLHTLLRKDWKVTDLSITEIWRKDEAGITSAIVGMRLFIDGNILPEIPYHQLVNLELDMYGKSWSEWLTSHAYAYKITSINNQPLGKADAILYRKALYGSEWNRLSDFVKYY